MDDRPERAKENYLQLEDEPEPIKENYTGLKSTVKPISSNMNLTISAVANIKQKLGKHRSYQSGGNRNLQVKTLYRGMSLKGNKNFFGTNKNPNMTLHVTPATPHDRDSNYGSKRKNS